MPLVSDPSFGTGTSLVIDPSEVAVEREEFELHLGDLRVGEGGPDWGQAAIVAAMAEAARGELPVDFRIPNRQITIPLLLGAAGGADFDTQRRYLQAKVALIQREGGWLKRQDPGKNPVYLDLVNAVLTLPDRYGHTNLEADVVLTLEALPDFYGDEIALTDHAETTLPEVVFTETDIDGDYPGRLRLVVDNDSTADQLGLVASVRSRHYDAAATARLAYQAEALTPLDTASIVTLAGASGGGSNNAVRHSGLVTSGWVPVLSTNLADGSYLTHKGSYRVRARVSTTSGVLAGRPPSLRLVWDVGDLIFPGENAPWQIPRGTNTIVGEDPIFYLADLGEIRLDPVAVGAHRWQGQIQARGNLIDGMDVSIDRVWFEPLDESHAVLTAPPPAISASTAPVTRDGFDQTAGALNGKTAALGGTWATSGDANDFIVVPDPNLSTTQRGAASDSGSGPYPGRFAILGSARGAQAPQIDFVALAERLALTPGVVARYVNTNNYAIATINAATGIITVSVVVAGTETVVATQFETQLDMFGTYSLRLSVGASGAVAVWFGSSIGNFEAPITNLRMVLMTQHPALATGGALASGKAGFYDGNTTAISVVRIYDNFLVTVPVSDAVAFAGQSVQLGTDGNFREDAAGAAYGPVSIDSGDLLRIPPSGIEARTVEFMVKPSRGDFDQLPDAGIDDVSARAYYRPSWLQTPW
jgi:hypothetical protein